MAALLAFENVAQRFGSRSVLAGIDLRIEVGERVALVGPSGAGKSTLFRLAYGAFAPTSGRVLIASQTPGDEPIDPGRCDARTLRATRARIGVILQTHGLVERLSARANVIAGTFGRRTTFDSVRAIVAPRADERELAREALAHVGLADRIDDRVFELSGGQRQRVAVARAIAQRAELVLADEPAASLDPELAREIVTLLLDDARERGTTLLCTLHQPELTRGFDRVIELRDGVARDTAKETTAA
jgi:phosphonate transport system ATP-binding protein